MSRWMQIIFVWHTNTHFKIWPKQTQCNWNSIQFHFLCVYSEYKSYNTVVNECKLACKQHQDKEETSSVVEFLQEYRHYEVRTSISETLLVVKFCHLRGKISPNFIIRSSEIFRTTVRIFFLSFFYMKLISCSSAILFCLSINYLCWFVLAIYISAYLSIAVLWIVCPCSFGICVNLTDNDISFSW